MAEVNEGSGARGAGVRSGRIFFNEKKGRIEVFDNDGALQMLVGDVTDREIAEGQFGIVYVDVNGNDKVFQGPKSTGILETYFAGKLQVDIDGGTLDGGTYSFYQLKVYLHHRFSESFPLFQMFYDWWGQELYNDGSNDLVKIQNKLFPGIVVSGTGYTTGGGILGGVGLGEMYFGEGIVDANDPDNPNTEYMLWSQNVSWVSGTVTIAPQTLWIIILLTYLNEALPTVTQVPTYAQGGGGGTLTEEVHFYL